MTRELHYAVRCVLEARNELGESPVWSAVDGNLYWVDILGRQLLRWRPGGLEAHRWDLPTEICSLGLRAEGGLILAMRRGFYHFDPEAHGGTGALTPLRDPFHQPQDEPAATRFNDGKVSPEGRFWVGTMDDRPQKEAIGSLYCLYRDGLRRRVSGGLRISNGLAWSPDGATLYHADSLTRTVWQRSYDAATGEIGPCKTFVVLEPSWGLPDGAAIDQEGCYWSAGAKAGRLNRFCAQGQLIGWLPLPVSQPTMPCFGGPEMRTLYVTSAREGLSPQQLAQTPLAGALFAVEVDVPGVTVGLYRG